MQKRAFNFSDREPPPSSEKDVELESVRTFKRDIKEQEYGFYLTIYKSLKWIYFIGLIFLLLLFFVFLPLTEMKIFDVAGNRILNGRLKLIQEWARAFIYTSSTVLIGLGTILLSIMVKKIFDIAKKQVEG